MSTTEAHSSEEYTFETDTANANAGASQSYPIQASALRKGGHIVLNKTRPCKITSLTVSKPGKHGHAKVSLSASDVFTGKRYEHGAPSHSTVEVPVVRKREYLVLDVASDGFASLFDIEGGGETKDDLRMPEEEEVREKVARLLGERKGVVVVVLAAMGEEAIVEAREAKDC